MKMFNSKLRTKNEQLEQENTELHNTVSVLLKEIERRDAIIAVKTTQEISRFNPGCAANAPDPFAFDFPGTEKTFDDFWAKFAGPKNKES